MFEKTLRSIGDGVISTDKNGNIHIMNVVAENITGNFVDKDLNELEAVGSMHDIGKIAINNNILNKPGKLTEQEYEEIKKHPEIGYHILKSADAYTRLAEYLLSHHEQWDGKEYPRVISGEKHCWMIKV